MFQYEDVAIRAIEQKDLAFLAECRNDPSTWQQLGTLDFANEVKQLEWWKTSSLDKSKAYFVFTLREHPLFELANNVGFVRLDEIDHVNKSIRIGGDIHPNYRGKGLGTKMYKLLFRYCFDELGMNRLWLFVLDSNRVARNLYLKMGMIEEGCQEQAIIRNGIYHNYIMMRILRSEWVRD